MYELLTEQEKYIKSLDPDIKASLRWYTGGDFDVFNESIRKDRALTERQSYNLNMLDKAFLYSPPIQSAITVYKGKSGSDLYSDKSFVSTTVKYKASLSFADDDCCVVQITVSPGSKVLPLRSVSREPYEEEVLLDRGGELTITGTTINDDGMKIIFATYNPKNSIVVSDEKQIVKAEKVFDKDLIVERIVKFFEQDDEDLSEFLDEDEVIDKYFEITGDKIPDDTLEKIKTRLGISD